MFRSSSFLKRTVCTPEMALTMVDFPCATWPMVLQQQCVAINALPSGGMYGGYVHIHEWLLTGVASHIKKRERKKRKEGKQAWRSRKGLHVHPPAKAEHHSSSGLFISPALILPTISITYHHFKGQWCVLDNAFVQDELCRSSYVCVQGKVARTTSS